MTNRISTFLANDHGRLLSLFREFQQTDESDFVKRQRRFERFCEAMNRHGRWVGDTLASRIEEQVSDKIQKKLERFLGGEPEKIDEHIRAIREKLSSENGDTTSNEQQLLSRLQDHFSKEEQVLYPLFDEYLSEEERSDILEQFENQLSEA